MSHYTVVKNTCLNDFSILMKALQKLGYEVKENYVIRGHQRDRLVDVAVKVKGEYCVGFQKNSDNSYHVVADWPFAKLSPKKFIARLKQVYNTEKVIHEARVRGYALIRQEIVNGMTHLVLRKIA